MRRKALVIGSQDPIIKVTLDMTSFGVGLAILALLSFGYMSTVVIYRLWFHPLSKYPGPLLARLSNLYSAYYAWNGDLHIDMWRCHERYGDFVRYAPNRLLVNTNTGLKAIYGFNKHVQKSTTYNVMVHGAPSSLTMTDTKQSAQRRKIVSQGFSSTALSHYESIMMKHIRRLANQLVSEQLQKSHNWSTAQNVSEWSNRLSFDIISDIVFGAEYNMIDIPDHRYVVDCIDGANVRTSVLFQAAELKVGRIDRYLFPSSIKARNRFVPFVSSLVKTRVRDDTKRNDVFSLLSGANDPDNGEGLSIKALGGESTTLVMAGSDTTSTVIAATFFYLSKYPEAYSRVKSELQQTFPTIDDVRLGPRLSSCKYLRACIDESLRLSPPVGGAPWRRIISEGLVVDSQSIPVGCDVGISTYALHHNPAYFPDPFIFRPSRWLVSSDAKDCGDTNARLAQSAFAPFSIGPRSCLGKGLAYAELTLSIATLLRKYDMRATDGPFHGVGGVGLELLGAGIAKMNFNWLIISLRRRRGLI